METKAVKSFKKTTNIREVQNLLHTLEDGEFGDEKGNYGNAIPISLVSIKLEYFMINKYFFCSPEKNK